MTLYDAPVEDVCQPARPGHVIMPNQRNFTAHVKTCQKFGGRVSVLKDMDTQVSLGETVTQHQPCLTLGKEGCEWNIQ